MNPELFDYLQSFLTPRRQHLFQKVAAERTYHFTVAIEDVGHLHNTSAVMRSCEAFGIQDLHVIEELKGRRIDREIAMGAQKWTDVHRYSAAEEALNALRAKSYKIVATTPHHEKHTLKNFDISQPAALFFGSEAKGLSDSVMEAADDYVYIPTYGFTQSLNISVCAAIIMQDLMQRLRSSECDWQLTEKEQLDLKVKWLRRNLKDYDQLLENFPGNL